ncbi:MAG: DUF47 family protein [Candidatus Calescibacterium sp.]|nr:DUF47 family protein [Candidatus Calescibacterium sp.]
MSKGLLSIFPKHVDFFRYLCECSEILIEVCKELKVLYDDPKEEIFNKIIELEHRADKLVYEYRHKLNEVFITPLDREDLHQLIIELDDIIDFAKSSAEKYFLYKPKGKYDFIDQILEVLMKSAQKVKDLMKILKNQNNEIIKIVNEICELEKQADIINRRGIANLFNNGQDILEIIKVKEILSQLEETIDRTQMLAITIENSIFKHI